MECSRDTFNDIFYLTLNLIKHYRMQGQEGGLTLEKA